MGPSRRSDSEGASGYWNPRKRGRASRRPVRLLRPPPYSAAAATNGQTPATSAMNATSHRAAWMRRRRASGCFGALLRSIAPANKHQTSGTSRIWSSPRRSSSHRRDCCSPISHSQSRMRSAERRRRGGIVHFRADTPMRSRYSDLMSTSAARTRIAQQSVKSPRRFARVCRTLLFWHKPNIWAGLGVSMTQTRRRVRGHNESPTAGQSRALSVAAMPKGLLWRFRCLLVILSIRFRVNASHHRSLSGILSIRKPCPVRIFRPHPQTAPSYAPIRGKSTR
jgi:hypothetical protein